MHCKASIQHIRYIYKSKTINRYECQNIGTCVNTNLIKIEIFYLTTLFLISFPFNIKQIIKFIIFKRLTKQT